MKVQNTKDKEKILKLAIMKQQIQSSLGYPKGNGSKTPQDTPPMFKGLI